MLSTSCAVDKQTNILMAGKLCMGFYIYSLLLQHSIITCEIVLIVSAGQLVRLHTNMHVRVYTNASICTSMRYIIITSFD